jgi:hypothetical protein
MVDIRSTPVPLQWDNEGEHQRRLAIAINGLLNGKHNAFGSVTLTASSATTTLQDQRIGANTVLHFTPTTANAAAGLAVLYQTYPNTTKKQSTLNHANNSESDRTYVYSLHG